MLKFDAETSRILDDSYQGSDVVRRRRANFEALRIRPGDDVLDIGCGTGLLTSELARAVGDQGSVTGIDPSEEMLNAARERCTEKQYVRLVEGTADRIPVQDMSIDRAISLQVFEYLTDIPTALKEVARVLRPRGRLVIGDIHWDSWIWLSDDPERMARVMAAWDGHLSERCVAALLPAMLKEAGFAVDTVTPVTFSDTVLRPDGVANMMLLLIENYVKQNGLVPAEVATEWAAEQRRLATNGRFFFSLTHFVVSANIE